MDWKLVILGRLRVRNAKESGGFTELISSRKFASILGFHLESTPTWLTLSLNANRHETSGLSGDTEERYHKA